MNDSGIQEKYLWFCDALSHLGAFLLDLGDDDIEYRIFEEFDGDSISFLHPIVLDTLLSAGYITREVYDLSLELNNLFRATEGTPLWNVAAVRTSGEWARILALADRIKSKLSAAALE